jgi:hypothetical protein
MYQDLDEMEALGMYEVAWRFRFNRICLYPQQPHQNNKEKS